MRPRSRPASHFLEPGPPFYQASAHVGGLGVRSSLPRVFSHAVSRVHSAIVAKTKGVSFVNVRSFCRERYGPEAMDRVLESMSPEDRDVLASVLAMGWYDLALYARLIRAVDATLGKGDLALIKPLGCFEAEHDISTVYRLFFRLANPAYAVEKTTEYWRRFNDTGTWHVQRESETRVSGTLEGWGVVDEALCLELTGYMPRVIELVGGKDAVMRHPRCRARGGAVCAFDLEWTK
jgi:hypothetical protein